MWVKDESLSPLAMLQVHKHKDVNDTDNVVTEFACLKGRRLALIFGNILFQGVIVYPFFAVITVLYRQQLRLSL